MARQNLIKHIRSAVQHNIPTTSQLEIGEIGLNTHDGKIFIHQTGGAAPSISEISIGEVFQLTDFNGHVHSVSITGQQAYNLIKDSTSILVRSSVAASHFHDVTISYDAANKTFVADVISDHAGHTFATSGGGLPAQSLNNGKFLSTDGTTTSWENLPSTLTVKDVSGTNVITDVSEIRFDDGTGFNVTDLTGGVVKVALGSHWKDILVNGQTTLSPTGEEPLEIEAGNNVVITTDSTTSPKKLIIGLEEGHDMSFSTTAPASPSLGDDWWNTGDSSLYKYIVDAAGIQSWASVSSAGGGANSSDIAEHEFTATAGQTSFAVPDGGYGTADNIEVFVNGIKLLASVDFIHTDGTNVVLTDPADLDDEVTIKHIKVIALANVVNSSGSSAILPSGTTADRDVSPSAGYLRWNTTLNSTEVYNGTTWEDDNDHTHTISDTTGLQAELDNIRAEAVAMAIALG